MDRDQLLEKLSERAWFKATDEAIRKELLDLPHDFDGFLWDLASRPNEFEGVDVLRVLKIPHGNFIITPVFEVRSQKTNQIFTYEYASFKYGKNAGYRGILLLEHEGEIKYFVLKYTKKFSVGTWVYDTIGDFIQFSQGSIKNFPAIVEKEIKEELGLSELIVKRFIDLGQINPDVTLTNKQAALFAAVLDANDSQKIRELEKDAITTKKVEFGIRVFPINKLEEMINTVDDPYFLCSVLRLISMNIFKLH